jgi:hypothetical protein
MDGYDDDGQKKWPSKGPVSCGDADDAESKTLQIMMN